jgi:hypothetical protein
MWILRLTMGSGPLYRLAYDVNKDRRGRASSAAVLQSARLR